MSSYTFEILDGVLLTLKLSLASIVLAIFLGSIGCIFRLSGNYFLKLIGGFYSNVIRGIPDLVLILLIFFGGQAAINNLLLVIGYDKYIEINPFISGVFTLGLIFGAYLSETFRGAYLSLNKDQIDAALAYGMTKRKVFERILFPQIIYYALPGFTNNWLVLVKSTALVSIVGLQDMMFRAKQAADATQQPFSYFLIVALLYLIITSMSLLLLRYVEFKYSFDRGKINDEF